MIDIENPIRSKYMTIQRSGALALGSREILKFAGFPESLKYVFNSAIMFSPQSERKIYDRLISKLKFLSQVCKIQFLFAGRDFPIHTTLLEAICKNYHESKFSQLNSDEYLIDVLSHLLNIQIKFDCVLMDKENVLLTALNIPQKILEVRNELNRFYKIKDLETRPLSNILHISLARITNFKQNDQTSFISYRRGMMVILREVYTDPITLTIANISFKPVYDLLKLKDTSGLFPIPTEPLPSSVIQHFP